MSAQSEAYKYREELASPEEQDMNYREEVLKFIGWVTLAPSTHNTQPWNFEVEEGSQRMVVRLDKTKEVAEADPDNRDMYISGGGLLRHIELVGAYLDSIDNYQVKDSGDGTIATLDYGQSSRWSRFVDSPIAHAISSRRNYRAQYSSEKIEISDVEQIVEQSLKEVADNDGLSFSVFQSGSNQAMRLFDLTAAAIADAYASEAFRKEVSGYINSNFSKKETGLHGYSLTMGNIASLVLPKVIGKVDIGKKLSALNKKSMLASQGVIVISSKNDNHSDWIKTGRTMVDALVRLNQEQIQTSIFAAAIEMGDYRESVKEVVDIEGATPQLMFTFGKAGADFGFSQRQNPASITTFR